MRDSTKILAEVKINNVPCSPLAQWASLLILGGYWVGQAWFPHHKSMLTTHSQLLVLHIFRNSLFLGWVAQVPFQGLRWGWPACSHLDPLFPLPEDSSENICFLPVLKNLSHQLLPQLFKDSHGDSGQLPQPSGVLSHQGPQTCAKCSLFTGSKNWSSSAVMSPLLQTFPQVSAVGRLEFLIATLTSKDEGKRRPQTFPCPLWWGLPFAAVCCLVAHYNQHQIQLQETSAFLIPPAFPDRVSMFLLGHLTLLSPPVCFLFMIELSQELSLGTIQVLLMYWRSPDLTYSATAQEQI